MAQSIIRNTQVLCMGFGAFLLIFSGKDSVFAQQACCPSRDEEEAPWASLEMLQSHVHTINRDFQGTRHTIPIYRDPLSGEISYAMQAVIQNIDQARGSVLQVLADASLSPLRAYAADYFTRAASSLEAEVSISCFATCVSRASTDAAYRIVSEGNAALAQLDPITVDIGVYSEPDSAAVFLFLGDLVPPAPQTMTNDTIRGVYRGKYTVVIQKEQYKPARVSINLIDDPGTVVHCRLVKMSVPDSRSLSMCRLD